jgi:hypothetical protein
MQAALVLLPAFYAFRLCPPLVALQNSQELQYFGQQFGERGVQTSDAACRLVGSHNSIFFRMISRLPQIHAKQLGGVS